jgi:hypothetical protein
MRLNHALLLTLGTLSMVFAAGCGGGSTVLPPPIGTYSAASLNGSYVYQVHGTSNLGAYREVGVFTADGAGHVTGGSDDLATGGVVSHAISGTYQVAGDGTGFLTINPTTLGSITFAITLASTSKVYLMEADTFADGAGVAELQSAAGTTPSGTYVYRLHQVPLTAQNPVSEVGAMTITGGAVTGNLDQNLGGASSQLTLTSGTINPPATLGRGTGSITDSTNFTTNFIYYIVNGGKLAFLVTNSGVVEAGSAESQSGAVANGLSGSYAFGSRGDFGTLYDSAATVGQFTAAGGTISAYSDDLMQLGTYGNDSFTGTYTAQANGRVAVALNSGAVQDVFWMVNPSRAFFLVNDPNRVEDGTADLQTAGSFTAATFNKQYAMVMDGVDFILNPEILARIGTATFNGTSRLSVNELANASNSGVGAQSPGGISGSYQVTANGRIVGNLTSQSGFLTVVMYGVSGSDAYVLQVDNATNTSGMIELQH